MKKETLPIIGSVVITLLLLFVLLVTMTELFCCGGFWFAQEYNRHPVTVAESADGSPLSNEEAACIANEMTEYCFGRRDTLDGIRLNSSDKDFFNQREKHHLADCRVLFMKALKARNAALIISAILTLIMAAMKKGRSLLLSSYRIMRVAVGLSFIAVVIFAINFDKAYDWLHEILFDNYLWILNPVTDNLAGLMTVEVITETAGAILTVWAVVALWVGLIINRKEMKPPSIWRELMARRSRI